MVSDKTSAVTAPLVDVVDIAAIAAGLRKGSAVSGVSGDSSEGDGAEGGGRDELLSCRQINLLLKFTYRASHLVVDRVWLN